MLVLSRKQNERIVVGGSVVVTVVRISGDKVRLGIDAPDDVRVIREEVAERDEAERNEAERDAIAGVMGPTVRSPAEPAGGVHVGGVHIGGGRVGMPAA